jgi:hypothetical protein
MAEIDHRRAPVIGNDAIKQRHLTARVADVDGPDQLGEETRQRGLVRFEIVAHERTPAQPQEFNEQARKQCLSDARVARGDYVELGVLRHGPRALHRFGGSNSKMETQPSPGRREREL